VFGLSPYARLVRQNARGFWLAHALAGVGLHRLSGRKTGWLAFRHGKDEYGIDSRGAKVLVRILAGTDSPDARGFEAVTIHKAGRQWKNGQRIDEMDEREFFNETTEQRTHNLTCPKCGQAAEYNVTWVVRRKRAQLPRGADERDRARFAKAQSYMVRRDDKLQCANIRCRKQFDITTLQTLAFMVD
jgi:hypothetical protein